MEPDNAAREAAQAAKPTPIVRQEDGELAASDHHTSNYSKEISPGAADRVARFRTLIGIHTRPDLTERELRMAPNLGIYNRTIDAEKRSKKGYELFSLLINGALGLQIISAAVLTALGASNGSHQVVTAFGILNAILAGFLTFLKGSGLPNRMKYYQNEWAKVREYIEQRERELSADPCELDVEEEIMIIERMYEDVRQDVEANTPDSYVSISALKKDVSSGRMPNPTISRLTHTRQAREKQVVEEMDEKVMRLAGKAADRIMLGHHQDA